MRKTIGICAPFVVALLLAGCASQPSYYTTQLDTSGGLGPGDPITHASATIGQVTGVSPISDGDSEIAFEVDGSHADEIHYDSIMTLNNLGATPSLDVMNVDAMSHSAPSGTRLDGASSMNEVQMFMTARGPGSFAQALGNVANSGHRPRRRLRLDRADDADDRANFAADAGDRGGNRAANSRTARPGQKEALGVERQLMRNGKSSRPNGCARRWAA